MKVNIIGVAHKSGGSLLSSVYIEKELSLLGFHLAEARVRDEQQLVQAFRACAESGSLILCPLSGNQQVDALCIANVAKICGQPLQVDEKLAQFIANRGKTQAEAAKLSTLPKGAKIFPTSLAATPGFELGGKGFHIMVLPASATEQTSIFFRYLFPTLAKNNPNPCSCRVVRVMELSLEQVEGALRDLLSTIDPCIAVYEKAGEVVVRVSAAGTDRQKAAASCIASMREVVKRLGSFVYGIDVNNVEQALTLKAAKKGLLLAVAESGTGGTAAKRLERINGGRACLSKGWVFEPEGLDLSKISINEKLAKRFGSVSANIAAAMALGATKSCGSQVEGEKPIVGVGISLPSEAVQNGHAYVAACLGENLLLKEIELSKFQSVSQMVDCAVSFAYNLARKFADTYPELPKDSVLAEEAVLQGLEAGVMQTSSLVKAPETSPEIIPKEKVEKGLPKILHAIFPRKGDSGFDKFRKIALILCVCIFIGSIFYLVDFGAQSKKSQDNISGLQDEMAQAEKDASSGKLNIDGYPSDYLPKFAPFYKRNEDIKGWIKIPNTNVNFPVAQTSDNDYYHRLGFDKTNDYYGTPYLDFECDVKTPSTNLVVYGHNIKNNGQMFNDLTKYKQLSFYKENPVVNFDSVYRLGSYKIIGAFITNTDPSHDNGNVFQYTHFVKAANEGEFNTFVDDVKKRSIFDAPVDTKYGDELLTLSTCTYEFTEARFVVVARRVREGEDEKVDISKAVANEDAYYPAVYAGAAEYSKKLGKVKSIAIQGKKEITLAVGETATFTAKVSPADAPIQACSWDSSNKSVATIDKKTGVVTAVGAGEAMITAVSEDNGHVDSAKVIVTGSGISLEKVSLSQQALTLKPGGTSSLKVSLTPADASTSLTWKSSDETVVKVKGDNKSATVTAANFGTAKITVATSDGKFSATCSVTVAETVAGPTGISFAKSSLALTVGKDQTLKINATPQGEVPANVDISWDGGDTLSFTPDATGLSVALSPKAAGSGTLTATTDTGLTATCSLTITATTPESDPTAPVDPTSPDTPEPPTPGDSKLALEDMTLAPGEEGQIPYTVSPTNTQLTWTSSNPRVADVDESGYVTTLPDLEETTEVTITATTKDGSVKKTAKVTVHVEGTTGGSPSDEPANGNLGLEASNATVEVNASSQIPIRVNGSADEVSVVCVSSDTMIAEVDNVGNVRGINSGSAMVTITATNHRTKKTQTVSVTVHVTDGSSGSSNGWNYGTAS